ncbi:hypothetical protein LRP88_09598 [Fusarium phalaenopsidis]
MFRGDTATVSDICEVLTLRKDTLRELDNLEELKIWAGPALEARSELHRLDSQALVRALPPSLQKLHVKLAYTGLDMAGEALMTYISSTYRESPEEQKLKQVYFDVYEESQLGSTFFQANSWNEMSRVDQTWDCCVWREEVCLV